jgi:hypothetical protein
MTEEERIERECLREAREGMPSKEDMESKLATRVQSIELEGSYPDTCIVAKGERTYGGVWEVRFPIWDPRTGGTADGRPMPRFIGGLVYTEILEARTRPRETE